ncbi:MAG: NUDIX hydrolase [Patescibacteria group bacterium]|jgi:ADP-ribose pyrophosphatase
MTRKHTTLGKHRMVFKGIIYNISHTTATLPDGQKKTFEYLHRVPTAVVLAFDAKRRLVMTREYKELARRHIWHLVVGKVDKGYTPKQAAQLELQQEAGFKAKKLKLFYRSPRHKHWPIMAFIATGLTPSKLPGDPGEDIRPVPMPLAKAEELAMTGKVEDPVLAYFITRAAYVVRMKGWKTLLD